MKPILVQVTAANQAEAEIIAKILVEEKLAACVNILPGIQSYYHWKGKIEKSMEVGLTIKTVLELWELVAERVRELHSYECPEIIAMEPIESDPDYRKWWEESVRD